MDRGKRSPGPEASALTSAFRRRVTGGAGTRHGTAHRRGRSPVRVGDCPGEPDRAAGRTERPGGCRRTSRRRPPGCRADQAALGALARAGKAMRAKEVCEAIGPEAGHRRAETLPARKLRAPSPQPDYSFEGQRSSRCQFAGFDLASDQLKTVQYVHDRCQHSEPPSLSRSATTAEPAAWARSASMASAALIAPVSPSSSSTGPATHRRADRWPPPWRLRRGVCASRDALRGAPGHVTPSRAAVLPAPLPPPSVASRPWATPGCRPRHALRRSTHCAHLGSTRRRNRPPQEAP